MFSMIVLILSNWVRERGRVQGSERVTVTASLSALTSVIQAVAGASVPRRVCSSWQVLDVCPLNSERCSQGGERRC